MRKILMGGGIALLFGFLSCKKIETNPQSVSQTNSANLKTSFASSNPCQTHPIIDSMPAVNTDGDSVEQQTIIGSQRTNPYTIANMRQAYNNLGYASLPVNATNLYVRFLPNSVDQLSVLDSTLDTQGLDLFDTPMDYDVLQEGDYYQDPSIPDSSVTWQYAVVPASFQPPSGITYQILSQIHIPGDDYTAVETEAERLASIQDSINCSKGTLQPQSGPTHVTPYCAACGGCSISGTTDVTAGSTYTYYLSCGDGSLAYSWDVTCGTTNEWTGNQIIVRWNSSGCTSGTITAKRADGTVLARLPVTITPISPPPPPPPPAPDAQIPAGNITVSDVNFANTPGVRNVRVIAKRWFTIRRTYTDNNGHFQFATKFKHKVKIRVKFKNDYSTIKTFRLTKFWQMVYPITKTIGVYSANKNNIQYNFDKYSTSVADRGNLYWAAATTINAVQEFKDYATQENFGQPPAGLKIFLTRYAYGAGMTPMWNKRWYGGLPQEVGLTFFASTAYLPAGLVTAFLRVLKHEVDMAISYKAPYNDNYSSFYSDQLKTTIYHELAHSTHYVKLSENWYGTFVGAEINEVINTFGSSRSPYGNGSNQISSPIIALGESWAYHIGQYLADKQYGNTSKPDGEQGIYYYNGDIPGLNSHQIALENFDPHYTSDVFHWIPKGLYYDMMDTRNDIQFNPLMVDDEVSGYTNQQFFNAFGSSIKDLPAYKQNLLQQNNNNQSIQVINLFQQYGY